MVVVVAILVIVLLSIGVIALNMRRSSIEKRSVTGYKKTLGVLSDVVKRSESFGDIHQPTDEEIGQPHIARLEDSSYIESPDAPKVVVVKPDIGEIPRVKILPSNIAKDSKIVFDDFTPSSVPPPLNTVRVKVDTPSPDNDLSGLVAKLRPDTPELKELRAQAKPQVKKAVTKQSAAQKVPASQSPNKEKSLTISSGESEALSSAEALPKKSHVTDGPLTEVIDLADLQNVVKPSSVTKRRLDTSGSMDQMDTSSVEDVSDDDNGFGFITGNARLRKISTVAASVVAVAALSAGIAELTSSNTGSNQTALASGQHLSKTKSNISAKTPKKQAVKTPPVNSGSNGIAPISASPSVVSYAAPKGTYTITIKASPQGQCWVGVQSKANGPYLWMSTISPGSSATYHASGPIVVRVGAPPYATIEVNGLEVSFPKSNVQPFDMVFTPVNSGTQSSS
ncbi:MAG: DUF4115 domain-containing protein [Firmicutes bacterium]|nr:DUF4115 domain-containing protein [Bacillota bacterium]